jgi:hypothetical protein
MYACVCVCMCVCVVYLSLTFVWMLLNNNILGRIVTTLCVSVCV